MSQLYDPDKERPAWSSAKPIPCEDCGTLLEDD